MTEDQEKELAVDTLERLAYLIAEALVEELNCAFADELLPEPAAKPKVRKPKVRTAGGGS